VAARPFFGVEGIGPKLAGHLIGDDVSRGLSGEDAGDLLALKSLANSGGGEGHKPRIDAVVEEAIHPQEFLRENLALFFHPRLQFSPQVFHAQ